MHFLRRRKVVLVSACLLGLVMHPLQAAPPSEYALKSVFLYNFCHFIEWPSSAFASPNEPLIIGIVGQDPFGALLSEAIAGETYHGRPIRIEHYRTVRDIKRCHILFVSHSETAQTAAILDAVAGKNVVTVGENQAFIDSGGMIALTAEQNRVRLRVNATTLRGANVDVSSKLLRVAESKS
jgi:YfiR/HmsC-like